MEIYNKPNRILLFSFGRCELTEYIFAKIQVGHLNKGINPSSLKNLDFDPKYISAPIQAGLITAVIALAVSIIYILFLFLFIYYYNSLLLLLLLIHNYNDNNNINLLYFLFLDFQNY